ncbi:MAG: [FeFe] hydrogenase H-cluster maturation GTPase HydF [Lachnospiraceae bacterium]|nr:[FeFe] hydrogenase H-cluster maturation GTPase HydF [Lachnospiraceae bacterium]
MGMNQTPVSERVHIGFFGRRNAGKSSIINKVTGQELSVVSEVKGTTTDPVFKSMELPPMGPVVMMDTPGIDDGGGLGELRVKKSLQVLGKADVAVLVADLLEGIGEPEERLVKQFRDRGIPYLIVYNKADLKETGAVPECGAHTGAIGPDTDKAPALYVSAKTGEGIHELKEAIAQFSPKEEGRRLVGDLLAPGDLAVLVVPIDKAAPKGRLILPQQQAVRDILEVGAVAVVARDWGLPEALGSLKEKPRIVITDSQVFGQVAKDTPKEVPLTSFSILFARYKGSLEQAVEGAKRLDSLEDGDRVLMAEGCTHHRQCDDIGTVKLPRWIREYTRKNLDFAHVSGTEFPEDLSSYQLVVHCGGCMLNRKEMEGRLRRAAGQQVAMTNYGILIAKMKGILERSLEGVGYKSR